MVLYNVALGAPTAYLSNVLSLQYTTALLPADWTATVTLGGIIPFTTYRDLFIYRIDSNNTPFLAWRGILTDIKRQLDTSGGLQTTISAQGYWFELQKRLLSIATSSPTPGLPYNPYVIPLNTAGTTGAPLDKTVAQLVTEVLTIGYNQNAGTGTMAPIIVGDVSAFSSTIVGDPLYIQYETVDQVLEEIVSGSTQIGTIAIGEMRLDALTTAPTIMLDVEPFDPANGQYGIGNDKSGYVNIEEGENFTSLTYEQDFLNMSNSMVATGGNFFNYQIVYAPIQNAASIAQYGLQESSLSIGTVVSTAQINTYLNNLIQFIQVPIPTFTISNVNWFLNNSSTWMMPGDIVTITSPTFTPTVTNISGTTAFTARIQQIQTNWDLNGGELVTSILSYPVTASMQPSYGYANPSMNTIIGGLQQSINNQGVQPELFTNAHIFSAGPFTLEDIRGSTGAYIYTDNYTQTVNIDARTAGYLYTALLTVVTPSTAQIGNNEIDVAIVAPNGALLYQGALQLGWSLDITNILLASQQTGNFLFVYENTSPGNNTYTAELNVAYVQASTSKASILSSDATTGSTQFAYPDRWPYPSVGGN
jgi:hypothetical protein